MLLLFFRASIWPRRRKSFHQKLYSRLSAGVMEILALAKPSFPLRRREHFYTCIHENHGFSLAPRGRPFPDGLPLWRGEHLC